MPTIRDAAANVVEQLHGLWDSVLCLAVIVAETVLARLPRTCARFGHHLGWNTEWADGAIHIRPSADAIQHEVHDLHCICGPAVAWSDPDDGEPYCAPLVTHHALDGRD